jgi:hypothetical protein
MLESAATANSVGHSVNVVSGRVLHRDDEDDVFFHRVESDVREVLEEHPASARNVRVLRRDRGIASTL